MHVLENVALVAISSVKTVHQAIKAFVSDGLSSDIAGGHSLVIMSLRPPIPYSQFYPPAVNTRLSYTSITYTAAINTTEKAENLMTRI
ncbi:uncharacterized protein CIMG_04659 [Coccidioides immitis RS]|uniref:Uncharacterized protein n=2 Tax=Coccidioides immitis TaxID=5501 RepID=J3KDY3_COCIM|nr:uncharacterized protein CIMG_04659 [Coccidioides immitis RS]EAS33635.3 hypothetical protein CIMG_04659 [Coccidioides immitis RS]KMU86314.1 hypothetical protein CIHG_04103 [Coccidioides immitis H538.4]TPX21303.1 hypothetical protein DIZ76_015259 [Coccidioides immitis]